MTIGFDLGHDLDLEFSRSNMEFAISQPKMVWLPRNEKQTYPLNSKASNVTIRFNLGHDLDLGFSRSNMEFPISQPKVVRLPRNEKQTYRLNSRPQMWPMGLTLTIIKSPRYTGGDFMFLYRFMRRRPQVLVHAITFEQLLGFLSFLVRLLALTYRLTD